jgi:hypothetical protein
MNTAIAASAGLTLINSTTVTTQSAIAIDNVFSSTYDNYLIMFQVTANSAADIDFYWYGRISGTDTTANYNTQMIRQTSTTLTGTNLSSSRFLNVQSTYAAYARSAMVLFSPNLATKTVAITDAFDIENGSPTQRRYAGFQDSDSQFTGFKISTSSGTFSGKIKIYGYKNS